MIVELKKQANKWLIIGFVIALLGSTLKGSHYTYSQFLHYSGIFIYLVGLGLFIYGCTIYSRAKGHGWGWGLFGVLNIIGLVILFFLPDKHKVVKM